MRERFAARGYKSMSNQVGRFFATLRMQLLSAFIAAQRLAGRSPP
ncbi:hypothetical protein SHLI107390_07915 [Shewanella livingstonensis]